MANLILEVTDNKRTWKLKEAFTMRGVVVPKGFETNLASVPKIPLIYTIFKDEGRKSSVIHDYLYSTRSLSRKESDLIFYKCLEEEGVSKFKRKIMYAAVRLFGKKYYYK